MTQLKPIGSYAGAMGLGQFMPSSYRAYAVDFDGDNKRDIWTNPTDAIGSIANYLKRHGWVEGESIVHKTEVASQPKADKLKSGLKPSVTREQLREANVSLANLPEGDDELVLISLTQKNGEEYWLGRQNFYSITRYNHSRMYAMAVFQLAEAIRNKYEK
jgi:membrane-bound lytic murein transglycosylase B